MLKATQPVSGTAQVCLPTLIRWRGLIGISQRSVLIRQCEMVEAEGLFCRHSHCWPPFPSDPFPFFKHARSSLASVSVVGLLIRDWERCPFVCTALSASVSRSHLFGAKCGQRVVFCRGGSCCSWASFCCLVAQSCPTLCDPVDCSPAGSFVGFSRQQYWSGLPFPSLGGLPDPGIEPVSPIFPALAGGFFTTVPPLISPYYLTIFCWCLG